VKIYTSFYGKKIEGVELVGISLSFPKWFKGRAIAELAPTREIKNLPVGVFERPFELLMRSRKAAIVAKLKTFNTDIALLCFERDPNQCHRRIAGIVLKEWGYDVVGEWSPTIEKKKEDEQPALCF